MNDENVGGLELNMLSRYRLPVSYHVLERSFEAVVEKGILFRKPYGNYDDQSKGQSSRKHQKSSADLGHPDQDNA